jgi:glycosyltransferase involved in cell wall biosynthesis
LPYENVIIVDNCSTTEIEAPDEVVRLRLDRRVTLGEARNEGLEHASTPLVLFLDADDLLFPNAITQLTRGLSQAPDAAASVGRIFGWRPSTGYVGPWGFPPRLSRALQTRSSLLAMANVYRNMIPVVGASLLRTDVVRRAGGFSDSDRGEDWGLGVILGFSGRVEFIDHPTLLYRVRDETLASAGESISAILATRKAVRQRVRDSELVPVYGRLAARMMPPAHWLSALRRRLHRHSDWGRATS